jgi:hypothetical protein
MSVLVTIPALAQETEDLIHTDHGNGPPMVDPADPGDSTYAPPPPPPSGGGGGCPPYLCVRGDGCAPGILVLDPRTIREMEQEPYRETTADPYGVEVSTGELILEVTDLEIPWPGIPFRLKRTYRSQIVMKSELGLGWFHNYLEQIAGTNDTCAGFRWLRGDLWGGDFTQDDTLEDLYRGPKGSHLLMRRNYGGSAFVIRLPDGELHYFDATGYLEKVEDRFGNYLVLEYSLLADLRQEELVKRLTTVRGKDGQKVLFEYDGYAQLEKVTDCGWLDTTPTATCSDPTTTRTITYDVSLPGYARDGVPYDNCGARLLSVRSPIVDVDEDLANDFPTGKLTTYDYTCAAGGFNNLRSIADGRANASTPPGLPFMEIDY